MDNSVKINVRERRFGAIVRIRYFFLLAFLALCFLGGGGARTDIQSLLFVRPAAIICAAALLIAPVVGAFQLVRTPLLLLAGLAITMVVQLIPLPPELWMQLPGHQVFAEAALAAGVPQPWRPISLTPDLTLNSFVALVVPFAALIGVASITREQSYRLLPLIIGGAIFSAIAGVAQLTGGPTSDFYLYRITNDSSAVGLFSNRNHQAVLLAMTLPMLAIWTTMPMNGTRLPAMRAWIAAALGIFVLPMILVTGSRAGVALGAVGLLFALLHIGVARRAVTIRRAALNDGSVSFYRRISRASPWIAAVGITAAAIMLSRAEAVNRLLTAGASDEVRAENLPLYLRIAADFFPFGSGFGSFDPVFRVYEPFDALGPTYLNHAHNDLLELIIVGGLPAGLLLLIFLYWWASRSWLLFRTSFPHSRQIALGRLGSISITILLLSSLVDYPLRTPLMAALFAVACGWVARAVPLGGGMKNGNDDREPA